MTNNSGECYVGSWFDDKKHGYGVENRSDGLKYEGNFVRGVKKGKGKYTFAGSVYEGDFNDNKA